MELHEMEEDGEIRDERSHGHRYEERTQEDDEFSMSSYDGDQGDSLDIKPPQAVVARREKREKREKRERHRHKGERHKSERHRSRDHRNLGPGASLGPGPMGINIGHEDRRRDHRRHRNMERREGRRHEKHKERMNKHDRVQLVDFRGKMEKERKMVGHDRDVFGLPVERRRDRDRQPRVEYGDDHDPRSNYHYRNFSGPPGDSRMPHDSDHNSSLPVSLSQHYHEKRINDDRMHGLSSGPPVSPAERTEGEKRMARLMVADKQKEQSQKEADMRRQRREQERRGELRQQRVDISGNKQDQRHYRYEQHEAHKRRKHHHYAQDQISADNDDIQILSDGEVEQADEEEGEFQDDLESVQSDTWKHEESRKSKSKIISEDYTGKEPDNEQPSAASKDAEEVISSGSSDSQTDSVPRHSPTPPQRRVSNSDSTSTASEDDEDEENEDSELKDHKDTNRQGDYKTRAPSSDTSPNKDGRYDSPRSDLDERSDFDDDIGDSSPDSTVELKEQLPSYYPAIMGCRSVDEFVCLNRIEEGTYGVVYRAREKATEDIVALKRLKMEKEKEGFPITSLREVNTLLKGQHQNIVTVREIVVGSNMDKIYIVMDYVEHDLKSLMETMKKKKQSFTIGETKTLMIQLLRAVHHLHDNWILHRDLKTSNLLLSHRGILKVGDFGLAREYGSPLKCYTPIVVTLWYRAPELLLGTKEYSTPIDVWSVGCIFGELLGMEPMFPGKSDIDQLNKIFKDLGTPSNKIWPGYSQLPVVRKTQFADYPYNHLREKYNNRLSDEGFKLLNKFLTYNPSARVKCIEALDHKYFTEELPVPVDPAMFPTWPAKSENPHDRAKKTGLSPKPPSGGKNFKDLGDGEDENIAATHGFFLGEAVQPGAGFTLKF